MTSIQNFTKQEEQKMSGWNKWVGNYPKITSTYTYATQPQSKPIPEQTIIKPSLGPRIFVLFVTTLLALLLMMFTVAGLQSGAFVVALPFGLFFVAVSCLLIYDSFFNRRYIYNLTLDKTGIFINNRNILWSEVDNTYIMSKQEGKYTNYYLIIFKMDRTVEKLNLCKMATSHRKLSTLVEHYKLQWRTSELIRQTL